MAVRPKQSKCFVVSPIGRRNSDVRKRADAVLNDIIRPALSGPRYGHKADRIDSQGGAGNITEAIVESLRTAELVIVDLTDQNANVMYEMGIRQAWNLPLIPIVVEEELDELPFDITAIATIPYNLRNKTTKQDAQRSIRRQLRSIRRGERMSSLFHTSMKEVIRQYSFSDRIYASMRNALSDAYYSLIDVEHGGIKALYRLEGRERAKNAKNTAGLLRNVISRLTDKLHVFHQIAMARAGEPSDEILLEIVKETEEVAEKADNICAQLEADHITARDLTSIQKKTARAIKHINSTCGRPELRKLD